MLSCPSTPTTPSTPVQKRRLSNCRFIPARSPLDCDIAHFLITSPVATTAAGTASSSSAAKKDASKEEEIKPQVSDYDLCLKEQLLLTPARTNRILPFHDSESSPIALPPPMCTPDASPKKRRASRVIPKFPDKILDAPGLVDDYYLNLLDWSASNILAVALDRSVFLWNASTGTTQKLLEADDSHQIVTSLAFCNDSNDKIAVGFHGGQIQIWDASRAKCLRSLSPHGARVASLSWGEGSTLSSGSRDSKIFHHDSRLSANSSSNNNNENNHHHHNNHNNGSLVMKLEGHTQEVCGLKWSPSSHQLASGGNDNILNIWDIRHSSPRFTFSQFDAAVKALAWCPFQSNLLASGGGTADRKIRFFNTGNGQLVGEKDTKSQVCSIIWSEHDRELVSSHGFSHNQLILWKYENPGKISKLAEMTGHRSRVLHMSCSPDGTTVVSAAADETLRFWRIFGSPTQSPAKLKSEKAARGIMGCQMIR